MTTSTEPAGFATPLAADQAYAAIIEAHRDLSPQASAELNAALVLILASHIGDGAVLADALARARQVAAPAP